MPRRTALRPIRLTFACAVAISLTVPALAGAKTKTVGADLRVVGPGGQTLAQQVQYTGTVKVRTDPDALCFGQGSGGSGARVKLAGPTALGAVEDASATARDVRPLSVTDAFDFGLGLCGIGGSTASLKLSWYLKVNHENPELGGDSVKVKAGDDVLFALAPFPYPAELSLQAPDSARAGEPFTVRVFSYDDKGKRKPAVGASVTGGTGPTGSDGRTTVMLKKPARLIARHGKDIPSNREAVCLGGKCPRG